MKAALTILIVDGHQGVRTALARRLGRQPGVRRVVATATLATAVRMGRLLAPDLVIWDPRTVGQDSAHSLCRLHALGCPVLVLTSSLDPEECLLLEGAGAAGILFKGIRLPALRAGIDRVLATSLGRSATASYSQYGQTASRQLLSWHEA